MLVFLVIITTLLVYLLLFVNILRFTVEDIKEKRELRKFKDKQRKSLDLFIEKLEKEREEK